MATSARAARTTVAKSPSAPSAPSAPGAQSAPRAQSAPSAPSAPGAQPAANTRIRKQADKSSAAAVSPPRVKKIKPPATPLARTRRARQIAARLAEGYPDAQCELDFSTPLELAVATILSAQSTDVRVNMTTPVLFAKYRTAADYAAASRDELEELIKSTGFYRNKTTSLIGLGQALVERFDGEVPRTLAELVTLPGFGRKTSNVVLGNAFGAPGITVDTHMQRLVRRWGLTDQTDPVKIELELNTQLPPAQWTDFSNRVIFHGRRVCHAKRPACGACFLAPLCPSRGIGTMDPVAASALVVGPERDHLLSMVGLGDAEGLPEPTPAQLDLQEPVE